MFFTIGILVSHVTEVSSEKLKINIFLQKVLEYFFHFATNIAQVAYQGIATQVTFQELVQGCG